MALILNIDTATEYASLALSKKDTVLGVSKNEEIKDHASWIHIAIRQLMDSCGYSLSHLNAIAVTAGPGSYTGLRVGMATAKGLCYVLGIPLITENTLKVMARAFVDQSETQTLQTETRNLKPETVLVPMIDARRMEVFTAAFTTDLTEVMSPVALILDAATFDGVNGEKLVCFGNGSRKFQSLATADRYLFVELKHEAGALANLAYKKFLSGEFADLAYAEPLYLKEFYSTAKK